ncbi:hypothetical protein BHE74_00058355 [Ensete ventricosum]|nr:hypothetical protein BHE74_00058355 [Ensete ventricosum]
MGIMYTRTVHEIFLTPLSPSVPSSLPLRRRWLPLHACSRPAKGRQPLRLAPPPLLAVGLAVGGNPLRAPYSRPPFWALRCKWLCPQAAAALRVGCNRQCLPEAAAPAGGASARRHRPCGLLPLAGAVDLPFKLALAAANRPLTGGLGRGLTVVGRPCLGAGCGWPPLLLATFC